MLDHPPASVNWVNTTEAAFLGARTQNMTMICDLLAEEMKTKVYCSLTAKNPKTWTISITFWNTGMALPP